MAMCMKEFLDGVLSGSPETKKRHIMQATNIQEAINERWKRDHPTRWKWKHVHWFLDIHLKNSSQETRYRYWLTLRIIFLRTGKARDWEPRLQGSWISRTSSDNDCGL
ncbi:hypothetical protein SAMN05216264_104314 [Pseudomonas marincola]|nr:hypothetical protein [Pseudomonas marincola]SFT82198.1 hypothetical protein SAMN05216264_104314 [Pseudomonas marincola]